MATAIRYLRECGHVNDFTLVGLDIDNKTVKVYCMGCVLKALGVEPCETMTLEEFKKRVK